MALTKVDDRGLNTPIDLLDSEKIRLGTGNDLELFHDGNNSRIEDTGTGYLAIRSNNIRFENAAANEALLYITENAGVDLYYDNTKKFETTSSGATVTGQLNVTGVLKFDNSTNSGLDIRWEPSSNSLDFVDNVKARFGTGNDLEIYHDGSDSYIKDTGTGGLIINTNAFYLNNAGQTENMIKATENGSVELFYDHSKKFETLSNGAEVSGHLHLGDNNELRLGNVGSGGDLKIYHNGSESHLKNSTGALVFASLDHKFSNAANDSEYARIDANGIKFNGDSAAANALDDYEEGSFSPTVASGGTVSSYTHQYGYYIKIGRIVHWQIYMAINGSGSSGGFTLGSFPFTSGAYNSTGYGGATVGYANNTFQTDNMYLYQEQNSTTLIFRNRAGQAIAGNSGAIFANADFILFGQYITA